MEKNDPLNGNKPDQDDDTSTQGNSQSGRKTESRRARRINLASPYPLYLITLQNHPYGRLYRRVATMYLGNVTTPAAGTNGNVRMRTLVQVFRPLNTIVVNRQNLEVSSGGNQGLTNERIGKFENFKADNFLKGEKCIVCHDDIEPGREMVRLDCHISHILCKICADKWFKEHNTCPSCRKKFS